MTSWERRSKVEQELMLDAAQRIDGHVAGVPFRWANREAGWRTLSGPDHAKYPIYVVKDKRFAWRGGAGFVVYTADDIYAPLDEAMMVEDFTNLKDAMLFAEALSDFWNERRSDIPRGYDFIS